MPLRLSLEPGKREYFLLAISQINPKRYRKFIYHGLAGAINSRIQVLTSQSLKTSDIDFADLNSGMKMLYM